MAKITKDMEGKRIRWVDVDDGLTFVEDVMLVHNGSYAYIDASGHLDMSLVEHPRDNIEVLGPIPKQKKKVLKAQALMRDRHGDLYVDSYLKTRDELDKHCSEFQLVLVEFPVGLQREVDVDE